jgi:tRNA threonylcarbamoyladenosine biosynthesis protein TsaB
VIVAVTTSSPQVGVALLTDQGGIIGTRNSLAPMASSGACLHMLESLLSASGLRLEEASLFLADLGPGSFTGVKVGVTLAKTWGLVYGVPVGGASSFDLIDPLGKVVVPSKRGEYFVREPGADPIRTRELPTGAFRGFGAGVPNPEYPAAEGFAVLLGKVRRGLPEELTPDYFMEPSISTPKKPFGLGESRV